MSDFQAASPQRAALMEISLPMSAVDSPLALIVPDCLETARVSDDAMGRAYAATGDRGRAIIKTCIAGLFRAHADQAASTVTARRFHDGSSRIQEEFPLPWFALAVGPRVLAPAQVVAAVLPAVARRLPLALAARPTGLGLPGSGAGGRSWPPALLAALELCGVENVFSPSAKDFFQALRELAEAHGPGALACLGSRPFFERLRRGAEGLCRLAWLEPPAAIGVIPAPGLSWDRETLAVAHAGVDIVELSSSREVPATSGVQAAADSIAPGKATDETEENALTQNASSSEGVATLAASSLPWAVLAPGQAAPPSFARLVLEPGREALWDWPDMPGDLFISRRLVYS